MFETMKIKAERLLRKLQYDPLGWREFPRVIQIDTNNHCGHKYCGILCEYCYPQWIIQRKLRKFMEMPMEWIDWILKEVKRDGQKLYSIDMFLNGDGLTEPRLPEILGLSKLYNPRVVTQTFTNGTLPENAHNLIDKNLDSICFTISAHNRALYKLVHKGDKFQEAIKTLEYVIENRHSRETIEVHCVVTKTNFPYLNEWWNYFSQYPIKKILSPLVASTENTPSLKATEGLEQRLVEKTISKIAAGNRIMWNSDNIPFPDPCVLWHNCSFDVEGYFLQCCNWSPPEKVNYGTIHQFIVEDRTLKEVWMERLANRMRNPLCRSCNMKSKDWKQRLTRMKIETEIQT